METRVNRRIVNCFEDHHLFTPHQFRIRRGLALSNALQSLQTAGASAVGCGGVARFLAVDIAGAFDGVSHVGLLHKVRSLGIDGPLQRWLASYLDAISLQCLVGGRTSSAYMTSAGIPREAFLDKLFSWRTSTTRPMFLLTAPAWRPMLMTQLCTA